MVAVKAERVSDQKGRLKEGATGMNESMHRFVLSHSESGYDYRGEIADYVPDKQKQDWIVSYINELTWYASLVPYATLNLTCHSFFGIDKYVVLLKSTNKQDTRWFVENEVTICDGFSDFASSLRTQAGDPLQGITDDVDFAGRIRHAIRMTEFSENTKLFFLTDNDADAERLHREIRENHPVFLYYGSCVDAVARIPKVGFQIAICRCLEPNDRGNFLHEIEGRANLIVADLTSGSRRIGFSIKHPEMSQNAFLLHGKKIGEDEAYAKLSAALLKDREDLLLRKSGFINYIVFRYLEASCPQCLQSLTIGMHEMSALKEFASIGRIKKLG